MVVGHPEYYPRFRFRPAHVEGVSCQWDLPVEVFMLLRLRVTAEPLSGVARYREEFSSVV